MVVLFGASAFMIFIMPAFIPNIFDYHIYPLLTNMMGIFAILSALLFLYWAYSMVKKMKMQHRIVVKPKTIDVKGEEEHGNFVFCTDCELIEGRANICKGCSKAGEVKNGYPGKKTS